MKPKVTRVSAITRKAGRQLYKQEHRREPSEAELTEYLAEIERRGAKKKDAAAEARHVKRLTNIMNAHRARRGA